MFSGNELGVLLGWWMIHTYRVSNPQADLSNAYMLASTVSSKILAAMARKEGFNFEVCIFCRKYLIRNTGIKNNSNIFFSFWQETLTGFKWMGNKAVELIKDGKDVLFAYEEAIGFMCGTQVLDKDGISAGVRAAELSAYLEMLGLTLSDKLQEIYTECVYVLRSKAIFILMHPNYLFNT